MPRINIDGTYFEFEGQHRLIPFAAAQGIEIPYFCYHPAMSTPTNCRMCLVEVGQHDRDRATGQWKFDEQGSPIILWGRKPATACNTMLGDGMFVRTGASSKTVKEAQAGVLEYMLINHPLDCPICDQAGECPLQIWTYKYGPEGSRFEAQKVHKPKHLELGPRVVLDGERCINCTRCVRFTDEVSKSNQLTIVNRGDHNYPATPPGTVFDDPYSMNTIDICPVGALTSRAHRFKARVWEMAHAPGIDMNDATGTNITVWLRNNEVLRLTPRHNPAINDYWMPDAHRLNVGRYNDRRVSGVWLRGGVPSVFEAGIQAAADALAPHRGRTLFLGSAHASFESNFALRQLAADLGAATVYYLPNVQPGTGDGWLISDDRTPNAAACEQLGFEALDHAALLAKLHTHDAVYSLENDHAWGQCTVADLAGKTVVTHATQQQPVFADAVAVLLPAAIEIEAEGTYVNQRGMAQVSTLARQTMQMTPEMWMRLPKSRLDKGGVLKDNWRKLDFVFDVLPSWQLVGMVGERLGAAQPFATHRDIFAAMQPQFEALAGLVVSYKPPRAAFKSTQLEFAPVW